MVEMWDDIKRGRGSAAIGTIFLMETALGLSLNGAGGRRADARGCFRRRAGRGRKCSGTRDEAPGCDARR